MTTSRTDELLAILQEHFKPREEGWLWVATFRDGDDNGVVQEITGDYGDAAAMANALGRIVNGVISSCGIDRVYLALCRSEGRPTESDRELWRDLRGRIAGDVLVDMVVFNQREAWSMRAEDAAAA